MTADDEKQVFRAIDIDAVIADPNAIKESITAEKNSLSYSAPPKRDRIVVLGRPQAGKTVYMACLYWSLWKNAGQLRMTALDGATHEACLNVVQTIRNGEWPSSTSGTSYLKFEVQLGALKQAMVALDYPGEVFRRAFVKDSSGPDVEELLDHIDRAAAVIVLCDPSVSASDDELPAMDNDFGVIRALDRIRSWGDAANVPVAIVLTKMDLHRDLILHHGGKDAFLREKVPRLVDAAYGTGVFGCHVVKSDDGKPQLNVKGVVEPLLHVLEQMQTREDQKAYDNEIKTAHQRAKLNRHKEEQAEKTESIFLIVFFAVLIIAMCIAGGLTYWLTQQP